MGDTKWEVSSLPQHPQYTLGLISSFPRKIPTGASRGTARFILGELGEQSGTRWI